MQATPDVDQGFQSSSGVRFSDAETVAFYNQLLKGLTHKLNNLLAVIQGFSSLIEMQDGLDEATQGNLRQIKEASQNASTLGERVLEAGGCAPLSIENVNLRDLLPVIEGGLREATRNEGAAFEAQCDPDVATINVDRARFRTILLELVRNACEAAGEGGQVKLAVAQGAPDSQSVDVVISNTGGPIPADKLTEIFKPFVSTKDSSHYGIGLTVANVLSAQMGIDLAVRNDNDAVTFRLRVPAAKAG